MCTSLKKRNDDEMDKYNDNFIFVKPGFPNFGEIRTSENLCDVILQVDGRRIHVNKAILAGSIPYFYAMFTHDMSESHQEEIIIKEIDPDGLELLIGFAYTGKICITPKNVQSILIASSFLQVTKVIAGCCNYMEERLHLNNALGIRKLADALGCSKLFNAANSFLLSNLEEFSQSEDFLDSEFQIIKDLISQNRLPDTNEEQVFMAVVAWVKHNSSRTSLLPELLPLVRMLLLSHQFIKKHVCSEELITTSPQCKDLVNKILKNHTAIYVLDTYNKFHIYYPATDKWEIGKRISVTDEVITEVSAVASMHDKIYVFTHECVFIFDPFLDRWSKGAHMRYKRSYHGVAIVHNKFYVCGGFDYNGLKGEERVECYDPEKNVWTNVTSMPNCAGGVAVVALENQIYTTGGKSIPEMEIKNYMERYNPHDDRWTSLPPMLSARHSHAAATLNGCIYVCGGFDGNRATSSAEMFNPATNRWKYVASMKIRRSRLKLIASNNKLYAIGGFWEPLNCTPVEAYDPENNTWEYVAPSTVSIKIMVQACVISPHLL